MAIISRLIVLLFWLSLTSPVYADVLNKPLQTADKVSELEREQGYLLLYVNADGVAPSIEFSRIRGKKPLSELTETLKFDRDYQISFKDKPAGLYLVPMFAGNYQITNVNAPFYDLPFSLTTRNRASWRFAIEADKINFIGEISIAKARATNTIDVNLHPRIAVHYQRIGQELAELLTRYPLVSNLGYRDQFLTTLEQQQ